MNAIPDSPDRIPAHILLVELTTRITTQPLHYRSGNEETAADSVYKLFAKVRELMEKHPDAKRFHVLALKLLNATLRPYTARWHRWLTASKAVPGMPDKAMTVFKDEQVRRMFRAELIELQQDLAHYLDALAALAAGQAVPAETQKTIDAFGTGKAEARLGTALQAGLPPELAHINAQEHADILHRRKELNCLLPSGPLRNATGLALSGGGIRSATFCLGIVQTLAQKDLFHHFDYLSTVSGGGYLGTFLSSVLSDDTDGNKTESAKAIIDEVLKPQKDKEPPAIRHLRNNSKYLGAGGVPKMAGLMVFGISANLLLLLPAPLLLVVFVYLLNHGGFWDPSQPSETLWFGLQASVSGWLLGAALTLTVIMGFALPCVQSLKQGEHRSGFRDVWEKTTLWLTGFSLAAGAIYLLPAAFQSYAEWQAKPAAAWQMLATGALPFLSAYGAHILAAWKRIQKIALGLFVLSGPAFFLSVFFAAGDRLGLGAALPHHNYWTFPACLGHLLPALQVHADALWLLAVALLLLIWGWFLVNINTTSPHRYYRNRLCECYLLERHGENIAARPAMPLGELCEGKKAAPYHLVNTTVNLTNSKNPELRGRNGDFFVISKHYCGSAVSGYHPTADVVGKNPHLDLGSAMAISGAAASTGMGWKTLDNFRFLMGVMNVRLGYWLYNPDRSMLCKYLQGPGPWYLYKEIFGWMQENDRYLNLSDGGHIENLAVYELLRRKCKFIVCVDGGHEPGMECADLIRLQRYAAIDLGIRMEYDITDLQLNENRPSRAYAVLVKIIYSGPKQDAVKADWSQAELGWMVYIKLSMIGTEPPYVADYRRQNPAFPHQTTADQFFDEAQFEAYRMLGECAAESLFRSEIVGDKPPKNVQDWFQVLANNLLPDNDVVFHSQ